jgi:16S rRNA (guanine527-N7)-methyltransferase
MSRSSRPHDIDLRNVEPFSPTLEFLQLADEAGIDFERDDTSRLGRYLAMVLAFNQTTNLTAITDPAEAWRKHIFDSLTLLAALADLPEGSRVIDIGSGGGLPGIPLAITQPHLKFTLLEATGKKAEFLRQTIEILELSNTAVVQARAEAAGHDRGERTAQGRMNGHREKYDVAVARAVGRLNTLAELTVPFVRIGGRCALVKGLQAEEEVQEAEEALALLHAVFVSTTPTPTGQIVVLEKSSATPRTYPRADGEPKRVPLGGKSPRLRDDQES